MTIDTPNADTAGNPSGEADKPSWWIDEGVPGIGEKPSWLGEKFKTVADLGKSYSELEKRVGSAPENYDFSKSQFLDPDYAPFQELQDFAKSRRVPQDVMDKVIDSVDKYLSEFSTNEEEEFSKLGENAKDRLQTLDNWAQANLSPESYTALASNMRNADSIKALEELRNKMMTTNTAIPNGNDQAATNVPNMTELQEELNNNLEKYKTDPKYRKDLQARMEIASQKIGFVDKFL